MAPSNLKRYIAARRQPTWAEQHFPTVELPKFLEKFLDGLIFALCSLRAWLMILFTCGATLLCSPAIFDLSWDSSMSIVAVGTVFPLVFAIQAAYSSRNQALKFLGQIKSRMMYLYFQIKVGLQVIVYVLLNVVRIIVPFSCVVCPVKIPGTRSGFAHKNLTLTSRCQAYDQKYKSELAPKLKDRSSDLGIALIKSLHKNEHSHECYDIISGM